MHKSKIPDSYLNISEICSAFSIPKTKLVNSLVSNHLYFVGPYILENNQAVRVLKSKANFTNDYYSEYIP
ncbi:hypothetical protein, partial [Leuconostoc suionicum]|uniref:hypothetical protein n=1 Tax=Leuconostoc suionicum TaxID=1511761 RepID=UPI00300C381D